ncbi:MAG: metallophosphoesterase [Candidatus Bathyarchaeia archaeon]
MDLNSLINESITVKPKVFLELINDVGNILSSEQERGIRGLALIGKLIYIPSQGEAIIVGDIHGDLSSLKHILSETRFIDRVQHEHNLYLIFLGDYGDRGVYSPEVYYIILMLKKMFPENIILIQGNHEGPEDLLARPHDLPYHLRRKFGLEGLRVYEELSRLFRRFYTAVIIKDMFVMLHGGVPSEMRSVDDLAFAYKKHPAESHLEEILWSDPIDELDGKYPSPRGAGYLFGESITKNFLNTLGVKLLIRGHEPVDGGYKFNHNGKVLTLFSRKGAPYYNTYAAYLTLKLSLIHYSIDDIKRSIRIF